MPYSEETTDDLIMNLMLNTPYNPETAEPNQVYLTPDTTDQDIADAISEHNTSNTAHSDIRHDVQENQNDISTIESKIPSQATSSNQLADKNFVNSSISTNTANFIGTFNSLADLQAYSGTVTNNDYAFVIGTDADGNTIYNRYKYTTATTPASWVFEYALNNSSFTSDQWTAINSGVTANDVSLAQSALQPNDNVSDLINDAEYITLSDIVSSVDDTSTNSKAVGAKLFYDTCGDIETALQTIRGV